MDFYGLIEKTELESIINQAKKKCINNAVSRLRNFDPMNETFLSALYPENTPKPLIKKRTNKLLKMKLKKDLKRMLNS